MKKSVLLTAFLAVAAWNVHAQTGAIRIGITAEPGIMTPFYDKAWSACVYDVNGQLIKGRGSETSDMLTHGGEFLSDIPAGDVYVSGFAQLSGGYMPLDPFKQAWFGEYYNNAPDISSATLVHITAGDTAEVTLDLELASFIVVATSPEPLQVTVDGVPYASPHMFRWRQSDCHGIGVDEWIQPAGQTYKMRFREWRHGGSRMQDYSVPAGKFLQVADSLIARFDYYMQLDVTSEYGHSQGSGWHKAWTPVPFSVEDSVIEYSDKTFRFPKPFDSAEKDSILHLFDQWEGTGYLAYSGSDNPATVSLYTPTVEKAHWRDKFPLVAVPSDTAMGKVTVQPDDRWHFRDSTAVLRAVPKKGCRFIGWEGAKTDTHLTITVLMDTSKSLTAHFEKIETGFLEVQLIAKPGLIPGSVPYQEKSWGILLYDVNGQQVTGQGTYSYGSTSIMLESIRPTLYNIPAGDYYVSGGAKFSGGTAMPPSADAFGEPWLDEYYDNAPDTSSAALVTVTAGDTTHITIELDWVTFVVVGTSPEPLPVTVDGEEYGVSTVFSWRQSEIHALSAEDTITVPGYMSRFLFRDWSQGGSRMQDYVVPAPLFREVVDSLIANYDYVLSLSVTSQYGHPQGSGWHKALTPVQFSVEDSVIEYSDETFRFLKPSNSAEKDSMLHVFDRWEGMGRLAYSGRDNPATVSLYTTTIENAHWLDKFPLVAVPSDTAMGKVTVMPDDRWHFRDSTAVLRAVPKTGCRFTGWEGAKTDTHLTVSVLMDTSKSLTACFEKIATGSVKVRVVAKPGFTPGLYNEKNWGIIVYDTNWKRVEGQGTTTGTGAESTTMVLSGIPVGDYYVFGSAVLSGALPRFDDPFASPWLNEYYGDAPDTSSATPVKIPIEDTARVTIELDWVTFIAMDTSPKHIPVSVDSIVYTVPTIFSWRQSEIHVLGVDTEYVTIPGDTCIFNSWKQGGSRVQNYTVPPPQFQQVADSLIARFDKSTGVDRKPGPGTQRDLPRAFCLYPNFPNPFNPETELRFDVPERERVRIVVLSMDGKQLAVLADAEYEPGQHRIRWNGSDSAGGKVGSGIYLCVMTAGKTAQVVKMLLLK